MNFWKRLRWGAGLAFATVLLIALVAAFYRYAGGEVEPAAVGEPQRVTPVVPVPAMGPPTRNNTGL